jgi:putative toxin-antitoxin system antitoxin component (TIGR02293 family)
MKKSQKNYTVSEKKLMVVSEMAANYYSNNSLALIEMSRLGILKQVLIDFINKFSFSLQDISKIFHVSERTLQRYSNNEKLNPELSERMLMLSDLYKKGSFVFGSDENFNDWMRTTSPVFNNNTPLSYLDTSFGFQLIHDELGKIEHGIFA